MTHVALRRLLPFLSLLLLLLLLLFLPLALACEDSAGPLQFSGAEAFFDSEQAQQPIDMERVDYALLSEAVFHETNRRRAAHDLAPLKHLPELETVACLHVQDMLELEFFDHVNPYDAERKTPLDRARFVGLRPQFISENIAQAFGIRYDAGEQVYPREENGRTVFSRAPNGPPIGSHAYASFAVAVLDSWMASPDHRESILDEVPDYLGAACEHERDEEGMDMFYCAQLFFVPRAD